VVALARKSTLQVTIRTDINGAVTSTGDRFEQLLEFAPDAVVGVGREGRIEFVNSQVEQIFGFRRDELIGEQIEKLIPERFHPVHEGHRTGYFGNPRTRSMGAGLELYARRKDGSEFPCEISLSSIETEDGRLALAAVRDVTERHEAQARFEQLLEFAPDAVVGVGREGRIELVNSQVEQLFGYRRDELVGEPIEKLIPERFHPVHEGHRTGYFGNPRTRSMGAGLELYARRKDGSQFPCEISLSSIETEDGRLALAAVRDVTDRHRAEDQFRQLLEFAPDAVVGVGREGRIELVNSQVEQIFGYRRDELLGEQIEKLIPERYHPVHEGHRSGYFGNPRTRSMGAGLELRARRRDGSEFPCEISLSSIVTDEGRMALAAVRDVTERHQAEEDMRWYAAIIAFAAESIISVQPSGVIESCNPSAANLYGYSTEDMIGQPFELLSPPGLHVEMMERFAQAVSGSRVGPVETVRLRKDGTTFDSSLTLSPIRDAAGKVVGVASVSLDITERKLAEEELRRTSEQLARSNADLEQFAYVASHDLSEPLRTVSGFVQLLAERHGPELDGEASEYIAFASAGTARMQELLDGLLAYSRAGTMEQTLGRVDCRRTVERVLSGLESSIAEARAEIEVGELPVLVADPTQLEQLFQNLLANALKFRGSEPARIEITAEPTLDGHIVSVADHGIGIRPDYREQVFKMFTRLHSREEYAGIGAGLAICRQIAIRNGGRIWVEETPGGGSTFRFALPSR
jgi:PAS domain S-box-containing protein